jgi:hypothetical protein
MTAQKAQGAQADVLLHRIHYALPGRGAAIRTNCNAVLKELGPKNLNWIVARSSHTVFISVEL